MGHLVVELLKPNLDSREAVDQALLKDVDPSVGEREDPTLRSQRRRSHRREFQKGYGARCLIIVSGEARERQDLEMAFWPARERHRLIAAYRSNHHSR